MAHTSNRVADPSTGFPAVRCRLVTLHVDHGFATIPVAIWGIADATTERGIARQGRAYAEKLGVALASGLFTGSYALAELNEIAP